MYGHGYDVHIAQTAQLLDVYGAYETDADNANAEPLHYAKHSFFSQWRHSPDLLNDIIFRHSFQL